MIRDSGQFGSFDGLDNRKTVMELFVRLGKSFDEVTASFRRARFLQGLIGDSTAFSGRPLLVSPCSAVEAYHLFIAITGCLGVPIERAAKRLEHAVRRWEQIEGMPL